MLLLPQFLFDTALGSFSFHIVQSLKVQTPNGLQETMPPQDEEEIIGVIEPVERRAPGTISRRLIEIKGGYFHINGLIRVSPFIAVMQSAIESRGFEGARVAREHNPEVKAVGISILVEVARILAADHKEELMKAKAELAVQLEEIRSMVQ